MALTAVPVGFVAGLFGIGGGLITVPFLFFIFEALGIDKIYLMHLAVGTSFAIIIPTSMVSVYTHHLHKSVDTNIIIFEFENENLKTHFITKMNNSKIKIISMDKQKLRMVTHKDYTEEQHEYVLKSLKKLC